MLPAMLHIPTFIYFSQSCMQMMPRIAYQLHSIVATSPALSLQVSSRNSWQSIANLSQQIQNFSLQILHQPVRIDCLGLTVLNAYLMTRVSGVRVEKKIYTFYSIIISDCNRCLHLYDIYSTTYAQTECTLFIKRFQLIFLCLY